MPLYEYRCEACGRILEVLVKNPAIEPQFCGSLCPGSEQLDVCPPGRGRLTRILSVPSSTTRLSQAPSDETIAKAGLTKYVNRGDGTFEKAAGSGPDRISK